MIQMMRLIQIEDCFKAVNFCERNQEMSNKSLTIIGTGGHAKVCLDIAELMCQWNEIKFITDDEKIKDFMGYPVLDKLTDNIDDGYKNYFVAIGDALKRREWQLNLLQNGGKLCNLIHPTSIISKTAELGVGTVVMAGVIVNPGTIIGNGCIINTSCSIDHDNLIGDYSHLSPGVCTAGGVAIGDSVWVGVGTNIINNIRICSNCTIGAGSLVIRDINEEGTYVGVPAYCLEKK